MINQKSLAVRAMQIAVTADGGTYTDEALAQAIRERFGDDSKLMAEAMAKLLKSAHKTIAVSTRQLPEQQALPFDVPELIAVPTPVGDLLINGKDATTGQSRAWGAVCEQWHKQQGKRFTKFNAGIDEAIDAGQLDPERNHRQQLRALAQKRGAK